MRHTLAVAASTATMLVVAACAPGDDATVGQTTSVTTSTSTAHPGEPAEPPEPSKITEATPPGDGSRLVTEADPSDELLERAGRIDVTVYAPRDAVDDLTPRVVGAAGDIFAASCARSARDGIESAHYVCERVLPGAYEVTVDGAGLGDEAAAIGTTCGNDRDNALLIAEVAPHGNTWCEVSAMPPTLRLRSHDGAEPNWSPTIVRDDGELADLDCDRYREDGAVVIACRNIAFGTYTLPPQPFAEGSPSARFECYPLYGWWDEDAEPGEANVEPGLSELGAPLGVWECSQFVSDPDLPGEIQLAIGGTPSSAASLAPTMLQDGVDIFPTHCDTTGEYDVWLGLTYVCADLVRNYVELIVPETDGARVALRCDPAVAYASHRAVTIDLLANSSGFCSAASIAPTLAIVLSARGGPPEWNADEFLIEGPTGRVKIDACDQVEVNEPGYPELWIYCSPLLDGTFVVPDQPVVEGGPTESFTCVTGLGIGGGESRDNTATLAVVNEDGYVPDQWSCNHRDP